MSVTSLFVELLIIGLGVICWLVLFMAYLLDIHIDSSFLNIQASIFGPLVALTYILGIVADRLIREPFMWLVENQVRKKVIYSSRDKLEKIKHLTIAIKENKNISMELEKFIRANSKELGDKIDYNRSRLRICRAWIFHFMLITISFALYSSRLDDLAFIHKIWIISAGVSLFFLTLYTSIKLAVDYQNDLLESTEIIMISKKYSADSTESAQ